MKKLKKVKAPINGEGVTQGKIYDVVSSWENDITEFNFTIKNDDGLHVSCNLKSCEKLAGDNWIVVEKGEEIPKITEVQVDCRGLDENQVSHLNKIVRDNGYNFWYGKKSFIVNDDMSPYYFGFDERFHFKFWFCRDLVTITYDQFVEWYAKDSIEQVTEEKSDFKTILDSIGSLLEYKNANYGNAVLEPLSIFANKTKAGVRLDDKLARIKNSEVLRKNDVADVLGYLVLICKENNWTNFDEFKD